MTFDEFYKNFGFEEYPFAVFSSEGEKNKAEDIYLQPDNYSHIAQGIESSSAIVVGERGTGKTALGFDVCRKIPVDSTLIVRIEEFSSLPIDYKIDDLYKFLTSCIASEFFIFMADKTHELWRYSREDRIALSMFLHNFVRPTSKALLKEKISKIQNGIIKRVSITIYNFLRHLLNYGLKAATKMVSDVLTKHFSSLPEFDSTNIEYFPKYEAEIDESFVIENPNYFYLDMLCKLIHKSRISKILVLIDKVDEDPRFDNDAERISEFIKGFASDNKILINPLFQVLLFLWTTPFNYTKANVRTQKLVFQKLEWNKKGLEGVINKRVKAFSNGKVTDVNQLFDNIPPDKILLIYEMANENPRDLWHIMDKCFKTQFELAPTKKISDNAVNEAIKNFVVDFNYFEYYPKKSNSRSNSMDVYSYIKHLLKLDDPRFTKDKLNRSAGTGSSTNNYVVAMESMGLIRKSSEKVGGAVIYEIRDPKVVYALENHIFIDRA